jgi:hypothetical protein
VDVRDGSDKNGVRVITTNWTVVPYPGTIAETNVHNTRGFSFTADGPVLSSSPTFGIGIAINRGDPGLQIKNLGEAPQQSSNGLWVTMGDERVIEAVKTDANELLTFFRETNEMQKQRGYYQLEDLPLEARILLAWAGGMGVAGASDQPFRLENLRTKGVYREAYDWNTVSINTLRKTRALVYEKWVDQDVNLTFLAGFPFYLVHGKLNDIRSHLVNEVAAETFKPWIFSIQ